MDNPIGNAVADAFGIHLAPGRVVLNAARFGRKPNALAMLADVIKSVRILLGMKVWKILLIS